MEICRTHLQTTQFGAIATFLLLLISYFLLWKPIERRIKNKKRPLPPEAAGAWPLIGHLRLLAGPQLPHITLGEMADKYGAVFTVRMGVRRAIVVSSAELAKELLTKHDSVASSRPYFVATKHLGYGGAMPGFSPYGPYWREIRKITAVELLSSRRLDLLKHIWVSETENSVRDLYDFWSKNRDESAGGRAPVEMNQWLGDLNLNIILRLVVGKRYFGSGEGGDKEAARRCQKMMREFFHLIGLSVAADTLPFLGWLDVGGHERAMRRTGKEMDEIVSEWLEEHRRGRKATAAAATKNDEQDFMDVMLSVTAGADFAGYDADTVIKATCMGLIIGAADTMTVVLIWVLSLLMNHPQVLQKAKEELAIHVGKDRQVNESDISNLGYLQAVVKEALRLYPPGPLIIRQFSDDCLVDGYHVAKGTMFILNLWKLQRDPKAWPNPSEFSPERFLTSHRDVQVKGHHFELIPFSAGRRICPGTAYGLHLVFLVLASLLHGFELSTPGNAPVDMTPSTGQTNMKTTPLEVLIKPRLSHDLYCNSL